jgi:basic membrane protein A
MRKQVWSILGALIVLSMVLSACGGAQPAPNTPAPQVQATSAPAQSTQAPTTGDKIKVAFVYVAPIGDLGWTWAQDQGRLAVEKELGLETAYIENVPEGPDAERVIRDFAQKGYQLIFTTSFGFMDPTVTVAKEFPKTTFVHISGYKTAANLSTVFGGI